MKAELERHIERTHAAMRELREQFGAETSEVIDEALEELSVTLEELEVTSEELQAQNAELQALHQQLRQQHRAYEQLFEFAPDPYLVTDRMGVIREANRPAAELLDVRADRLAGRPLAVFVPADDRAAFRRQLLRVAGGEPAEGWDFPLKPAGRTAMLVSAEVQPASAPDGSVTELRWLLRDVTEARRAQAALQQAVVHTSEEAERLRELDQWKDAFLAAAAHDLRSPLSVITELTDTLLDPTGADPVDRSAAIRRIRDQAQRLDRLVVDLLALDRFTRGVVEAERRPVDVAALVNRVVAATKSAEHPVDVEAEPVSARLDAPRVEQIVGNLLSNAVTHTPPGTPVHVRVTEQADRVLVVVEDEGPGIPQEVRDRLFLPFVTHPLDGAGSPGTGLGLSLVRLFAELHGGSVQHEGRPGGGARFVVELPTS